MLVGWGFQLQNPFFVATFATILFAFSLNLFGIFEWGLFVASWAGNRPLKRSQEGNWEAFASGILATAIATPCTGPFLGSAVGLAMTLPAVSALLIFTAVALGLSTPYLLCAFFPALVRYLPKPGEWMNTFKQAMGFLMMGSVLWLLWVFEAETNEIALISLLAAFLLIAVAAWIYGKGCTPVSTKPTQLLSLALACSLLALSGTIMWRSSATWSSVNDGAPIAWSGWEEFSLKRLEELRAQGTPVLIDFTAKWCLICQANHIVLTSEAVETHFHRAGIVKMRADWTKHNPEITQTLAQFGRNSVPLYVLYGSDSSQDPVILPQVLTPQIVIEHVHRVLPQPEIAQTQ